jgi:CheY-like chemotaxis protein
MDEIPPILVVEDEVLVRLTIAEALEEGGYTVLQAADGPEAIALIEGTESLRGLVTDIRLGAGADGWEIAHHARVKFPCIPVVYATGDSATEWSANGVPQSAILQKPFASAEIIAALANLLVAQQNAPL